MSGAELLNGRRLALVSAVVLLLAGSLGAADRDLRLVQAAKKGDTAAVRTLLKERPTSDAVNAAEGDGSTALLWAAAHSDLDMAHTLIAAKANVNAANRLGVTPLLQASRLGDT